MYMRFEHHHKRTANAVDIVAICLAAKSCQQFEKFNSFPFFPFRFCLFGGLLKTNWTLLRTHSCICQNKWSFIWVCLVLLRFFPLYCVFVVHFRRWRLSHWSECEKLDDDDELHALMRLHRQTHARIWSSIKVETMQNRCALYEKRERDTQTEGMKNWAQKATRKMCKCSESACSQQQSMRQTW